MDTKGNDVPVETDHWKLPEKKKEEKIKKDKKYSSRLYPCSVCGKEKIRQSKSGYIPQFCDECRAERQSRVLAEGRSKVLKNQIDGETIPVSMPDGSTARLRDEDEKVFIEHRFKEYVKEFDWKSSSDYGLLTRLLLLELQTNRISDALTLKYTDLKAATLGKLTEEIRKCQHSLGIDREQRIDETTKTDAYSIVSDMMKRFNEFRKNHPERFMWKCSKCGEINNIAIENPNVVKQEVLNDEVGKDKTETVNIRTDEVVPEQRQDSPGNGSEGNTVITVSV